MLFSGNGISKKWKELVKKHDLFKKVIYREIAFGNDKWTQCFGKDAVKNEDSSEEFSSLRCENYIKEWVKFKILFPEINVKDAFMPVWHPKTFNGGLPLKNADELAKKYFSDSDAKYRYILSIINDPRGLKSIDKAY